MKNVAEAWDLIKKSKNITLLTHSRPDGDGISACLALELILMRIGKSVETVYPNSPEFKFERQPEKVLVGDHSQEPDLLIVCDTSNYERFYYPEDFKKIPLINIDHHVSNSIDGVFNFVVSDVSSACEVLFSLICEWDDSLVDKPVAQALLAGILYDTQVFRIQTTTSRTLRISADLMERGADLPKLKDEIFAHKDSQVIKMWEFLLGRVQVNKEKHVAWSYILQDDLKKLGLKLSNLVGFSNFLSEITKVDVTVLFYETEDGKTKVSLRSKSYDVNKLANNFGGGGHKNAAGILSDVPVLELAKQVVGLIT